MFLDRLHYELKLMGRRVILTPILRAARVPEGTDETLPHQYTADPEQAPAPVPAGMGAR